MDVKVTHDALNVRAYLDARQNPVFVMQREGSGVWLARNVPVGVEAEKAWSYVTSGDFVRVPLFPYQAASLDPAALMAFAFQLGFVARTSIGDAGDLTRLHIVLGSPLEGLFQQERQVGFKFWLGFAACVSQRYQPNV